MNPSPSPNPVQFLPGQSWRSELRTGALALLMGARWLISRPSLWKYTFFSILTALVVTSLLVLASLRTHGWLMSLLPPATDGLWSWIRAVIWLALLIACLLGALSTGAIVSSITAAPFNDRLSERVEEQILGHVDSPFAWSSFIGDVLQGVAHSLLNLAIYLPLSVVALALNLVPVLGNLASWLAGATLTAAMLSLELTDFPQARRRFTWREKVSLVRNQPAPMLGFGLAATALLAIPFMSLIMAPVGVVGGTLLFAALQDAGRIPYKDRRLPA
ncbi:MAG: EI24 domain-containing protein [Myxococcales bacterium]|jgi:CysZ protein|nr:EI24 domain-containing protein [Myxococcales bacterium]